MEEIERLKKELKKLKEERKISLAFLYGSFAKGKVHKRSDIDLAIYINSKDEKETANIVERLSSLTDRNLEILRLDDEDESPFIIQEALKGMPLVEPDDDILYEVYDRALHEAEGIRFRRGMYEED